MKGIVVMKNKQGGPDFIEGSLNLDLTPEMQEHLRSIMLSDDEMIALLEGFRRQLLERIAESRTKISAIDAELENLFTNIAWHQEIPGVYSINFSELNQISVVDDPEYRRATGLVYGRTSIGESFSTLGRKIFYGDTALNDAKGWAIAKAAELFEDEGGSHEE